MSAVRREKPRALREALRSRNRHERSEAAIRLGRNEDRGALAEVERLMNARDHLTAVSASYAAWKLGGGVRGVDRMIRALGSRDEETLQLAVMVLCEMGDAAVDELAAALEGESRYKTRIVRVLGDIGGRRALRIVRATAKSTNAALRREARNILS